MLVTPCRKAERHFLLGGYFDAAGPALFSGQLSRLLYAAYGIEAAGVADIGQALGDYLHEELSVIAQIHVALCMARELGLAASLGSQEAEGYELALLKVQAPPGRGCFMFICSKASVVMSRKGSTLPIPR